MWNHKNDGICLTTLEQNIFFSVFWDLLTFLSLQFYHLIIVNFGKIQGDICISWYISESGWTWCWVCEVWLLLFFSSFLWKCGRASSYFRSPHSSTLAWRIPWMEEPGRLQSMGSPRVGHNWATSLSRFTFMHWRRKWQLTPGLLPGESREGGAWWAAIYGVAQSWTRLKRLILILAIALSGVQASCCHGR